MIKIDKEFESLIPPLTEEEFKQLEKNCLRDGIRDPLIVWEVDNEYVLIDGHNRFRIVGLHPTLRFNIRRMQFANRDEAKLWIYRNQIGRRNLKPAQLIELGMKMEPLIAEEAKKRTGGGDRKSEEYKKSVSEKSCEPIHHRENRTDYKVAKEIGISEDTYRKGKVILNSGDKKLIEDVRKGDVTINKAFQVIKGIDPKSKSPAQMKQEMLDQKRQEHEDFKNSKTVTLEEVKADKANRKVIAKDLYCQMMVMGKRIEEISIKSEEGTIDIEGMARELTQSEITAFVEMVGVWRKMLTTIVSKVTANE